MKTKTQTRQMDVAQAWTRTSVISTGAIIASRVEGPPVDTPSYVNSITYSQNPRPQFNYCGHDEIAVDYNPTALTFTDSPPTNKFEFGERILWEHVAPEMSLLLERASVDSDSLVGEAWKSMRPSMATSFSLPTFLREFHEITKLAGIIRSGKDAIEQLFRVFSPGEQSPGSSPLRKLSKSLHHLKKSLKGLSEVNLNVNFGWLPTISDIKKIVALLRGFNQRMDEFARKAGKKNTVHWKQFITHDKRKLMHDLDPATHRYVSSIYQPSVFTATAVYSYKLPDLSRFQQRAAGLLDTFGVNLDPQFIWDAIPYSFVIDWIVDVGGFLGQFQVETLGSRIQLDDFFVSLKQSHQSTVTLSTSTALIPVYTELYCGSVVRKWYERRRVNPTAFIPPQVGALSQMEVLLGLSLVGARL